MAKRPLRVGQLGELGCTIVSWRAFPTDHLSSQDIDELSEQKDEIVAKDKFKFTMDV